MLSLHSCRCEQRAERGGFRVEQLRFSLRLAIAFHPGLHPPRRFAFQLWISLPEQHARRLLRLASAPRHSWLIRARHHLSSEHCITHMTLSTCIRFLIKTSVSTPKGRSGIHQNAVDSFPGHNPVSSPADRRIERSSSRQNRDTGLDYNDLPEPYTLVFVTCDISTFGICTLSVLPFLWSGFSLRRRSGFLGFGETEQHNRLGIFDCFCSLLLFLACCTGNLGS